MAAFAEVLAISTGGATPKKKLFGGHFFTFAQVSQIAGYIFFSTATLALNVGDARRLLPLVWALDEESLHLVFRQTYQRRLAHLRAGIRPGLDALMFYLETEFPDAFGGTRDGESVASWSNRVEKLARQAYPFKDALELWRSAAAEAVALVLFEPVVARALLDAQFAPPDPTPFQRESRKLLRDAGLEIPEKSDVIKEEDHAALMRGMLSAFLREEHPEMLDLLD